MSLGRILVIDDDPQIRRVMRATLAPRGYEVGDAKTGEEALEKLREETYDLLLLDMNMPGIGGLETCRIVRGSSDVEIIVLTVKNAEKDKVEALDAGADDYVTKPFSMPELLARVRAALRRNPADTNSGPQRLFFGNVEIDLGSRRAARRGNTVRLSPKEFEMLSYFVGRSNQTVSHRELLQAIWGPDYGNEVEYLRVFINRLRKKIEPDPSKPQFILTDAWVGYRFRFQANADENSSQPTS
jgi:two-component system, OmpR family, KDP operon response regulator KdpE